MSGTRAQCTTSDYEMFDPAVRPPPRGQDLLLLNPGGVLVVGPWRDCMLAWLPKPQLPESVRARRMRVATGREAVLCR